MRMTSVVGFGASALAMMLWYRRFRLPFSAFLTGAAVLGVIYSITASSSNLVDLVETDGYEALFDLGESPAFATATLIFGIGAFLTGMWFDTATASPWTSLPPPPSGATSSPPPPSSTPSRSRFSTVAAPALAVALVLITALALVIDRRSFLTAAIVYTVPSSSAGSWAKAAASPRSSSSSSSAASSPPSAFGGSSYTAHGSWTSCPISRQIPASPYGSTE